MASSIVCLSGGLDSLACLGTVIGTHDILHRKIWKKKYPIRAVHFQYGSKHNAYELAAVKRIASTFNVPLAVINLESVFNLMNIDSALMKGGEDIPEGHYQDETMKQTVVPARNMIFASILAGMATSGPKGNMVDAFFGEVILGIHAGDHAIYPDCRPAFFNAMRSAVMLATNEAKEGQLLCGVELAAPFLSQTKADIVSVVMKCCPDAVALTRTCYKDQELACGKCGSCVERLEAFAEVGLKDPIQYQ